MTGEPRVHEELGISPNPSRYEKDRSSSRSRLQLKEIAVTVLPFVPLTFDVPGESFYRGSVHQRPDHEVEIELGVEVCDHRGGGERISSQVEEVVRRTNRLNSQNFHPHRNEPFLDGRPGQ